MGKKLVAVHCMHEHEQAAARQAIPNGEAGDAFVIGELDTAAIEDLRKRGIIVQELEDVPDAPPPSPGGALEFLSYSYSQPGERSAPMGFDDSGPLSGPPSASQGTQDYELRLSGPLLPSWEAALAKLGLTVTERTGGFSFLAHGPAGSTPHLLKLSFVRSVKARPLRSPKRSSTRDIGLAFDIPFLGGEPTAGAEAVTAPQDQTFDILLKSEAQAVELEQWLRGKGFELLGSSHGKLRVRVPAARLSEFEDHPLVLGAIVEEYLEPGLYNDLARALLAIDPLPLPPPPITPLLPWTGKGQLVAVADGGLDVQHPDLQGRLHKVIARGRPGDPSDPNGHGTHVAGSIAGTGAASNGQIRGVAPEARLVFQSLMGPDGKLSGLPVHLEDLFEEAYQEGARIHNDSWGADAQARYLLSSREVDAYVARRRDMLVVLAAGNAGNAARNVYSPKGFVDLQSVGAPASCKNGLVVGASRSQRTEGGRAERTYAEFWDDRFLNANIANERISGNPECLAGFSSRGACGHRIKPDVVAPGTDIVSTRASTAELHEFWAPYKGNDKYAYMGGTSMATPLVSGCAALAREYYASLPHEPSAALVKATLINGTRWLTGEDAVADGTVPPNNNQGFGRVCMQSSLPSSAEPWMKLAFADNWKDPAQGLARTNGKRRFVLDVKAGHPLRICLAYTDLPASGLQNILLLMVESPGGQKWLGNGRVSSANMPKPDEDNNVAIVRFEAPVAGQYVIQVSAWNILEGPQDFALVATGDLGSELKPYN